MRYLKKYNTQTQYDADTREAPNVSLVSEDTLYYNGEAINTNTESGGNIIVEEDGIYQIKNNKVYPVSHPDLSTQPSILPQRFGKMDIHEVLIPLNENNFPTNDFDTSINSVNLVFSNYSQFQIKQPIESLIMYSGERDRMFLGKVTSGYSLIAARNSNRVPVICILDTNFFLVPQTIIDDGGTATYTFKNRFFIGPRSYFSENSELIIKGIKQGVTVNSRDNYIAHIDDAGSITTGDKFYRGIVELVCVDPDFFLRKVGDLDIPDTVQIPSNSTIIEASLFNSEACVPAICKKINNEWTFKNNEGITPDFALVRYIGEGEDYYYDQYSSSNEESIPVAYTITFSHGDTITIPSSVDVWGNSEVNGKTRVDDIVGKIVYENGDSALITIVSNSNNIGLSYRLSDSTPTTFYMGRIAGNSIADQNIAGYMGGKIYFYTEEYIWG